MNPKQQESKCYQTKYFLITNSMELITLFLRTSQLLSYSNNSLYIMELRDSLPCLQEPATVPILCQINPVPTIFPYDLFLDYHLCLGLPSGLFPLGFPSKIPISS